MFLEINNSFHFRIKYSTSFVAYYSAERNLLFYDALIKNQYDKYIVKNIHNSLGPCGFGGPFIGKKTHPIYGKKKIMHVTPGSI